MGPGAFGGTALAAELWVKFFHSREVLWAKMDPNQGEIREMP